MNKQDYLERSRKLRIPQRCPFVGYCQRWMWTIYFYNYVDLPRQPQDIGLVLERAGDLPPDFDKKKIILSAEPPQISHADDYYTFYNFCPEVPLFDRLHTPGIVPQEAIASMDWTKPEGVDWKEHKHFSECLEYIQNTATTMKKFSDRKSLTSKERFEILKRDNFRCVYCGRSAEDGIILHVDHKKSVKDGGSNSPENLVTSCDTCNFGKGSSSVETGQKPT